MLARKKDIAIRFVLILLALLVTKGAFGFVLLGSCKLPYDPRETTHSYGVCLRGRVVLDSIYREVDPRQYRYVKGTSYMGVFLGDWVSLHGKFYQSALTVAGGDSLVEKRTEHLIVAVGNPALHRFRLLAGSFYAPFGLNLETHMGASEGFYESEHFFRTPRRTVSLSYEDLAGTRLEVSVAVGERGLKPGETKEDEGLGVRLTHDLSAVGGVRMILSHYVSDDGGRRYGFAVLHNHIRSGETAIEWVRYFRRESGPYPFDQLIQLHYLSTYQNDTRWRFDYRDELERFYLIRLFAEHRLAKNLTLKMGVGYYKKRFQNGVNHWFSQAGLEAKL